MKSRAITVALTADDTVKKLIDNMGWCDLIYKEHHTHGDFSVSILMFENYYFRNSAYAALTITISSEGSTTAVSAIASASARGILGFDHGAAANFTKKVIKILEPYILQ